jgi:hypothetical protein
MQPSRLQSYVSPAFSVHRWLPISKATTETLGLLGHKEDIECPAARVARRGLIAHIALFTRIDLGFVPEMVAKGVPSPRIKVPQRTRRFCNFLEAELIRVSGCEWLRDLDSLQRRGLGFISGIGSSLPALTTLPSLLSCVYWRSYGIYP